jgi:hypothetical protein
MEKLLRLYRKLIHKSFRKRFPPDKYPFSDDLCNFIDAHPETEAALKLSSPGRFVTIPLIFTSGLPVSHPKAADEVIGIWYYDKNKPFCRLHKKACVFKQDFIVNVAQKGKEFIVYTANKKSPPYVQPIDKFFKVYGSNGKFYHDKNKAWNHHYATVRDLPNELRLRILASTIEASS